MDDIDRLLKYKFKKICDFEKQSVEIQEDFGGSMIEYECDPNALMKHALPCDDVVSFLISDASYIRIVRKKGKTILHTMARYGKTTMVKLLIERDLRIVLIKDKKGQTAFHMAVKPVKGHSYERADYRG
ncbi:ankyrin repeat-containing protein [Tanacetum coccineum]